MAWLRPGLTPGVPQAPLDLCMPKDLSAPPDLFPRCLRLRIAQGAQCVS
jgi:hypothetical protein